MAARRLYLRLYLAFLGVLLAVAVLVTLINLLYGRPFFAIVRGGPRMAAHLARMLPAPGGATDMLNRSLEQFHDELGVDVLVVGLRGEPLAQAGAQIRIPGEKELERARHEPIWLPGSGLVAAPMRGGAVLLARLPVPEGAARRAAIRTALLLLGVLAVSLALIYPLSRSITRPIEKLTAAVEAYGRGDLSQRSGLGGLQDEVGKLARSFDEMADRVQAARKAEKELLANASHELRTPLARIKVALELIDAGDEATRRRLLGVGEEVDELDRLVADVLTTARLDLAALPLRRRRIALGPLLEKSRDRALALQPSLDVRIDADPSVAVEADEALLARAIDNLIDNARKYGNGSAIDAQARRDGAQAVISVRDRGPGIPEPELEHIFDPFFRGQSAAGSAGFGLGLALARRVAEAHGGAARASNAEGGGARMELLLPAADEASSARRSTRGQA